MRVQSGVRSLPMICSEGGESEGRTPVDLAQRNRPAGVSDNELMQEGVRSRGRPYAARGRLSLAIFGHKPAQLRRMGVGVGVGVGVCVGVGVGWVGWAGVEEISKFSLKLHAVLNSSRLRLLTLLDWPLSRRIDLLPRSCHNTHRTT